MMNLQPLYGQKAIAYAEANGLTLSKYHDGLEGARNGLTVAEARKIAEEDPRLIHITPRKLYWRVVGYQGAYVPKAIFATRLEAEEKLGEYEVRAAQRPAKYVSPRVGTNCQIRGYLTRKAALNADISDDKGYI